MPTNVERADRARTALAAYAATNPTYETSDWADGPADVLIDLLTDLRHWCAEHEDPPLDIDAAMHSAYAHWVRESDEETDEEPYQLVTVVQTLDHRAVLVTAWDGKAYGPMSPAVADSLSRAIVSTLRMGQPCG